VTVVSATASPISATSSSRAHAIPNLMGAVRDIDEDVRDQVRALADTDMLSSAKCATSAAPPLA
jgi:hypothetical protein